MCKSVLIIGNNEIDSITTIRNLKSYGVEKVIAIKDQEEALLYIILNNPKQLLILGDLCEVANDGFEFIKLHNKIITDNSSKICLFSESFIPDLIKQANDMSIQTVLKPLIEAKIFNLIE